MRLDGWESRLADVIHVHSVNGYEPGKYDCFRMAQQAIEAITGDLVYRGVRYNSDRTALRQMMRRGFSTLGDAMRAVLLARERGRQKRGDIAVLLSDHGDTLGIVYGATIVVKVGHSVEHRAVGDARFFLAVD